MSFEGFDLYLCENGHKMELDVYDPNNDSKTLKCPWCGAKMVWSCVIDVTNGYDPKSVPKLKVKAKAKLQTCDTCGHVKCVEPETYHIPKKGRLL